MKVDAALFTTDLGAVPDAARRLEAAGYDGIYSVEGPHDALFPCSLRPSTPSRFGCARRC
jgi:hypothetical protein